MCHAPFLASGSDRAPAPVHRHRKGQANRAALASATGEAKRRGWVGRGDVRGLQDALPSLGARSCLLGVLHTNV